MANPSKKKGTAAESKVVNYLRENGFDARRKALSGNKDQGDIEFSLDGNYGCMLEVKAGKQTDGYSRSKLEEWLAQARIESANCKQTGYLVIVRYRRKLQDAEVWFPYLGIMCFLDDFIDRMKMQ